MTLHEDLESAPASTSTPAALFQVGAVASMAGLRDSCGHVPLDACIPTVTGVRVPPAFCATAAYLLRHVDGHASLGAIADRASLSLPEAIESFLLLLRLGIVGMRADSPMGMGDSHDVAAA